MKALFLEEGGVEWVWVSGFEAELSDHRSDIVFQINFFLFSYG